MLSNPGHPHFTHTYTFFKPGHTFSSDPSEPGGAEWANADQATVPYRTRTCAQQRHRFGRHYFRLADLRARMHFLHTYTSFSNLDTHIFPVLNADPEALTPELQLKQRLLIAQVIARNNGVLFESLPPAERETIVRQAIAYQQQLLNNFRAQAR